MHSINKNHLTWIFLSLALLAATTLIFVRNSHQEWQKYQKLYFKQANVDTAHVRVRAVVPTLTGEPELCTTCHLGIEEISPSHPVEAFGCVICHGGEPMTLDKNLAHKTLRGGRNPSDLSVIEQSCGKSPGGVSCHNGYDEPWHNMIDRVQRSLQATAAGAIAHTRYTFGLQKSLFPFYGTRAVEVDSVPSPDYPKKLGDIFHKTFQDSLRGQPNSVEQKFVKNCMTGACHLNTSSAKKPYFYRATGCAACHYLYDRDAHYQGNDVAIKKAEPGHGTIHRLTTAIPFSQCNHCHNRGIYSLKQMRFLDRNDLHPDSLDFSSAQRKREKEYYIPLAQYSKCEITLDCIDCHTHNEIMGDGHIFPNKKAAVEIECRTCHGTLNSPPRSTVIQSADQKDVFIVGYNPYFKFHPGDTVAVTARGTLLPMVRKRNGRWEQKSKVNGDIYLIPQVLGSECEQNSQKQDSHSCHECHDLSEKHDANRRE